MESMKGSLNIDEYGVTSICSIYFDTPDYRLIRNSLEKPVYKEKLRLRSYGTPAEGDKVFVELKKKYQGIVYKRRERMELSEAEHYLYDYRPAKKKTQITREIDWFLRFYDNLVPSMYVSYSRIAMLGDKCPGLRITFDKNILWRKEELYLECGSFGKPLLEDGQRLMEIKVPEAMPIWLVRHLDELEIYPVSFSKYGNAYLQSQLQKEEKTRPDQMIKGEMRYA